MDRSNVTLERMRTFVRVAEKGSLTSVARELEMGQSTVTRQLRELEDAVGARLLNRTTRRLALTDEGQRYYADCVHILGLVEQAGEGVRHTHGAPQGTIRITCTAAFGVLHLARMLFEFQDCYPGIAINLGLTDERVDLVREGVDLALRLAPLSDSSMKLKVLGQSRRILVAAPKYLAARGWPLVPSDLAGHEAVRMTNVSGSNLLALTGPDSSTHTIPFDGRLRLDHGLAAREALAAGRGIGAAHLWLVGNLLETGALVRVLPEYTLAPVPLNLLIAPERGNTARVRLLVDFLSDKIGRLDGIDR